jgi:hypothetical protein
MHTVYPVDCQVTVQLLDHLGQNSLNHDIFSIGLHTS